MFQFTFIQHILLQRYTWVTNTSSRNIYICFSLPQKPLSDEDLHLLARVLSMGLVDADPDYLHHLKGYRDLSGGWICFFKTLQKYLTTSLFELCRITSFLTLSGDVSEGKWSKQRNRSSQGRTWMWEKNVWNDIRRLVSYSSPVREIWLHMFFKCAASPCADIKYHICRLFNLHRNFAVACSMSLPGRQKNDIITNKTTLYAGDSM